MGAQSVRPNVAALGFHVFGRSLHPELFSVRGQVKIERPAYQASVLLHDAGHIFTFTAGEQVISEVVAPRDLVLPQRKRLLHCRLRGQRSETLQTETGLLYQMNFQVDQLDPEVFQQLHEEILADSRDAAITQHFGTPNRLWPAPVSSLQTTETPRTLLLQSSHTFPENCAIVKVLTLIEI